MTHTYINPRIIFISVLTLVTILTPGISHGYFTTSQSAVRVAPNTILYTITYAFGLQKDDLYMPISAVRDLPNGANSNSVGYEITTDNEITHKGTAAAIVLSEAEIVDGMYKVPAGYKANFTLFALYTGDASVGTSTRYALHMQELPYYIGKEMTPERLNPTELDYYTTNRIKLK